MDTVTLMRAGLVAGPFFVAVAAIQVLTRDGFDLAVHPLSLLSVGAWGWVQIANFVIAGALTVAFAVGLRRVLRREPAGVFGPLLMGVYGIGLIAGGVFTTDPALGFPPGAPEGIPDEITWHAAVHNVAPIVAFNAAILASFVFVRRFLVRRQWGWAAYTAASGVGALLFAAWPSQAGISWRLAVAVIITFAWQSALALRLWPASRPVESLTVAA